MTTWVVSVAKPNNAYKVYTLDLSTSRSDQPLGLRADNIVANSALVVECDSVAYWKRNSTANSLEKLYAGYRVENFEMRELYITNPSGTGNLTILVEWRE